MYYYQFHNARFIKPMTFFLERMVVDTDFKTLHQEMLKKGRNLQVIHGNVVQKHTHEIVLPDVEGAYLKVMCSLGHLKLM